jgi:LmbE family N-acetylglucosaminyl deacetylase
MTGGAARRRILVVTAHPDDADIHAGGSIARWIDEGHDVHSVLLTRGDKGHDDPRMAPEAVARLREREQRAAAAILGVSRVTFLDYEDGELSWTGPRLAEDVTRVIRAERPDVVVTHDPCTGAPGYREFQLHPDHHAAGLAVVDAVYVRAPGPLFYPPHTAAGLAPHRVGELLLMMSDHADHAVDIAATFDRKVRAVLAHASQFGGRTDFESFLRRWAEQVGAAFGLPLAEGFKRLVRS